MQVSLLAALTLLLLAAGCGGSDQNDIEQPATRGQARLTGIEEAPPGQLGAESFLGESLSAEPWTGDLDGMIERRYIRALVVHSKTFYFYDHGQAEGVTYDILSAFERELNKKLQLGPTEDVHVVFIPVSRDNLIPGVVKGLGDIAVANLTITPERRKLVDFSDPSLEGVQEIVVVGPKSPAVATVNDLSGKEVYVRRSSSYYESLVRLNERLRAEKRPPVKIREANENLEDEDILEMVNAGIIPITVVDGHKANLWTQVFKNIRALSDVAISEGNAIGWAFRKGSPKLAEAANDFIATHKKGSEFGNVLFRRYFEDARWVRDATSEEEMAKFRSLVDLFQRYARQYEFDWLMVAAQAYQESRLDPNAKSPVGAVGIMQVMPSTAEAPPINIEDVHKLENNIHAGVKILRHYADQYFGDSELTELNRTLFSFAAYNAGPNRINRLRERAAAQGLDPNVWFRNVELVVAKAVGREPVKYVSNVFKYYIAYKLSSEAADLQ